MGRIEARNGPVNAAAIKKIERREPLVIKRNTELQFHLNREVRNMQDPVVNIAKSCGDNIGGVLGINYIEYCARTMFSEN